MARWSAGEESIRMRAAVDQNGELSDAVKRQNVIRLVFGGSFELFEAFRHAIEEAVPQASRVVVRGSAVTGRRWNDGAAFDADGPGTSDLDLTLVGSAVVGLFKPTGFFVPGVHSRPLSDEDPDIAPDLVPLRRRLMEMVKRPVNIQGTLDLVTYLRGDVLGQPYLTLIDERDA
jgi:hypothetical protein